MNEACEMVEQGKAKIDWAASRMDLLNRLREVFVESRPFAEHRIGMSIHLEAKTACLAILLRDGGAQVFVTGSNPLSTQDDVASALAEEKDISVYARYGVSEAEYFDHLRKVLANRPDLILDDGGDLVKLLHGEVEGEILAGCEETTTGVHRLRILDREKRLRFPMFAVNDAKMKYLFDNRYGTGQSVWDAILRSTNLLVAGKTVLVVGYGWCGRGIALRATGLGARVIVAEVDPVRAVEAVMDGFSVASVVEAIRHADFLITATGCCNVVTKPAFENAKDGLLLANAGHFDVEINKVALDQLAASKRETRSGIREYAMSDGRRLYLMGDGRLVNLVLGDGHPVEIMDISFALQALTLQHIVESAPLAPHLYPVPTPIDQQVARMKLESLSIHIDSLTDAQREYLGLTES
ncbi:MAG TPA: adenosylhomocysteinase [Candidatus Heimdallarchaeota archaeon]|nr:adenosylhomocysteinase [Candidatus Heimdallarchaeota archaeon]